MCLCLNFSLNWGGILTGFWLFGALCVIDLKNSVFYFLFAGNLFPSNRKKNQPSWRSSFLISECKDKDILWGNRKKSQKWCHFLKKCDFFQISENCSRRTFPIQKCDFCELWIGGGLPPEGMKLTLYNGKVLLSFVIIYIIIFFLLHFFKQTYILFCSHYPQITIHKNHILLYKTIVL